MTSRLHVLQINLSFLRCRRPRFVEALEQDLWLRFNINLKVANEFAWDKPMGFCEYLTYLIWFERPK